MLNNHPIPILMLNIYTIPIFMLNIHPNPIFMLNIYTILMLCATQSDSYGD